MKKRGIILGIIYGNQDITKFTVKDDESNDTFIFCVKNSIFDGAVGESFDFDVDCIVKERNVDDEKFINQHMFVKNMTKCS